MRCYDMLCYAVLGALSNLAVEPEAEAAIHRAGGVTRLSMLLHSDSGSVKEAARRALSNLGADDAAADGSSVKEVVLAWHGMA